MADDSLTVFRLQLGDTSAGSYNLLTRAAIIRLEAHVLLAKESHMSASQNVTGKIINIVNINIVFHYQQILSS